MSEPVTHSEIEDVLASIRRLVSDDGRDGAVAKAASPVRKPAARLVLTPSLRVADVVQDATAGQSVSSQPENGSDTSSDVGIAECSTQADISARETAPAPVAEMPAEPEQAAPRVDAAPEVAQAEPVLSNEKLVQEVEPPLQEEPQAVQAPSEEAPWREPGATLFAAADVTETLSQDAPASSDDPRPAASFAEKLAALEAVIGQTEEQWEPDGEPGEDNSARPVETLDWEDIESEPIAESGKTADDIVESRPQAAAPELSPAAASDPLEAGKLAEQAVADEVLGGISADESVMDEETLRELVADIVREELQGALGERITRNVRKLVRREIHRALAVQDLG